MANIPLKSIKFPDLPDTYVIEPEITDVQGLEDALNNKANIDGTYDDMTVGNAEQLVSNVFVEDKAPYQFRTAGGSVDIGKRAYFDAIVGGTVAWNQLAAIPSTDTSKTENGVTVTDNRNGTYTIVASGGATGDVYATLPSIQVVKDHKYFWHSTPPGGSGTTYRSYMTNNVTAIDDQGDRGGRIYLATGSGTSYIVPYLVKSGTVISTPITFVPQLIDLTLALGSTIADYIYTLETANAGAGVAFFRKYFPNSYYPYSAASLESVEASAHKTVGFNQFDKSKATDNKYINDSNGTEGSSPDWCHSDYIRVIPNTMYYTNAYGVGQRYTVTKYDENKSFIGAVPITNASTFNTGDAYYIIVSTDKRHIAQNSLVVNLHWDGSRDGEYEEYKEHTYPLDDSLTLRGIPKLVDGKLQFDGDEYEPDGTVNRRYGVVDLGSLTWNLNNANQFFASLPQYAPENYMTDAMCEKYAVSAHGAYDVLVDKSLTITTTRVWVYDTDYSTASAFKSAMDGVYLVYELATPTTEEADAYSGIQIVDDFGTEEFITDSVVPVGHVTHYPVNLVAKLEMMPNSPDGNGDYIVQQDSGINTYIPLASTDTITGIIARLEALENAES